jgi:hypothetical protein
MAKQSGVKFAVDVVDRHQGLTIQQNRAVIRFSVSSALSPADRTGAQSPIKMPAATSIRNDLPVPGVGAVTACSGTTAMAPRVTGLINAAMVSDHADPWSR